MKSPWRRFIMKEFSSAQTREQGVREVFEIGIMLKGVGALLETILGVVLLFTNKIIDLIAHLVDNEFLDDPNDFFATHLQALLSSSHEGYTFGALYLLSHGIVKLVLVAGLLRDKLWAYPASLGVFSLFILYQLVRWTRTHSPWLLALTAFDALIMWLIWHEYQQVRRHRHIAPLL